MFHRLLVATAACAALCLVLGGCSMQTIVEEFGTPTAGQAVASPSSSSSQAAEPSGEGSKAAAPRESEEAEPVEAEVPAQPEDTAEQPQGEAAPEPEAEQPPASEPEPDPAPQAAAPASLNLVQDSRASLDHGDKPASCQKYIMLHDTEGEGSAAGVIDYWDGSGTGVGAHFVVNKDGSVVQCVPLDRIAHHAGFGDTGHNAFYGVEDESRDDKVGTVPIGDWAADYGMNSYSVGIEMVHVGGSGFYPEEQLQAVDALIAHIDAYYGFPSQIIDHKAWRSGNSDTSPEFAGYLANYQDHRTHY